MNTVNFSVDDLLSAPIGVALLDRIEYAQRSVVSPFRALADTDSAAVRGGVRSVETMSWGELLAVAFAGADFLAGPWQPGAATSLALAYELAGSRRPIAEMICERFGFELAAAVDLTHQEYSLSVVSVPNYRGDPAFRDFTHVYGNGEFAWDGLWTVTAPPPETHDSLIAAWEMHPGPITRWGVPVRPGVRLWTVDRPSDWVRLVEMYPMIASRSHLGWELPGPNQHNEDTGRLTSVEGQHALRTVVSRHVLPDWSAVAQDFDGVHLSWAGFLTSEGYVSDLPSHGVTMLRYWRSERTLWLRDVFGQPEPLPAPQLSGRVNGTIGLESRGDDSDDRGLEVDVRETRPVTIR